MTEQKGIDKVFIGTEACRICVRKNDGFMCDAETAIECIDNLCAKMDKMGDVIDQLRAENERLRKVQNALIGIVTTAHDWINGIHHIRDKEYSEAVKALAECEKGRSNEKIQEYTYHL